MRKDIPIDFNKIFDAAPGLFLVLLPDLTIIAVSEAYLQATMTKREDIIGKGLFIVFPDNPDDLLASGVSNLGYSLQEVLKERMPHTMAVQKYDIRKPDGTFEVRYWSPFNQPVLNEKGEVIYIIHKVEDVTRLMLMQEEDERKSKIKEELELKVAARTAELAASNKELESFAYSVSHDLRAPLRSINGFSLILKEDHASRLDKEGLELLDMVVQSAIKMDKLIEDLLEFSRLSKREIKRGEINMNEEVETILLELKKAQDHRADIRTGKLHNAYGDASLIGSVLYNLVDNAVKYSAKKEKPVVELSSKEEDGYLVYTVKDNGAGFDMRYAGKLFGVFQRLHGQSEFEGNGVGLAIVQRIISRHGGKVWAEGKVDNGAVFYFSLPKFS